MGDKRDVVVAFLLFALFDLALATAVVLGR